MPRPEVSSEVSLSGDLGREELLARPDIRTGRWPDIGRWPARPGPGGGVPSPPPLK